MKRLISFLLFLSTILIAAKNPYVWVNSRGDGTVDIFWIPGDIWPKSWMIERVIKGKKELLAKDIEPLKFKNSFKNISKEDFEKIKSFYEKLKKGKIRKEDNIVAKVILGSRAAADIEFGYALGLRYKDRSHIKGKRFYIVKAVDNKGRVIGKAKSIQIDPYKKSPLPAPVLFLKARSEKDGVTLFWKKPKLNKTAPIIGYRVQRVDKDGSKEWITKETKIVSDRIFKKGLPIVIDENAPLESKVKYLVYSVDFFNNLSTPKKVEVFVKDFEALMPPLYFSAKGDIDKIILKWNRKDSENCYGYIIERANLQEGPFEILTPKGLKKDITSYEDKNVIGGVSYFYRIRAVNYSGEVGIPSIIRAATPISKKPPSAPSGLKAEVGKTLVKLKWKKAKGKNIAGYLIFRKAKGGKKWMQLNSYLIKENYFEDPYDKSVYGEFSYKVVAVSYDSKMSKDSNIVKVELIDQVPPNPPIITDIDASNGEVKIWFKPSPPYDDIDKFYLVRSVSIDDPGLVLGDAIKKDKRVISDNFVKYGQRYWYSLVAVDKAGNRSELSKKVSVVVEPPPIPKPERPIVKIVKKPILHILVEVKSIPKRCMALIFKSGDEKNWTLVSTLDKPGKVIDTKIEGDKIIYRVYYKSENGELGESSEDVVVNIKQ